MSWHGELCGRLITWWVMTSCRWNWQIRQTGLILLLLVLWRLTGGLIVFVQTWYRHMWTLNELWLIYTGITRDSNQAWEFLVWTNHYYRPRRECFRRCPVDGSYVSFTTFQLRLRSERFTRWLTRAIRITWEISHRLGVWEIFSFLVPTTSFLM